MANLRAVILAAGRGLRMGGERPKTLIEVDDHEPLLFYLLHGLTKAGVEELLVVTGFKHEPLQDYIVGQWGADRVTFVRNMRYASWGNFHSVRVALDQSPGFDVLVVNSDVIVHPDVFKRVANAPGDLVIAVEQRYGLDKEDMRVRLDGDKVLTISKELRMNLSNGEFCGVSLLRPPAAALYRDIATELEWRAQTNQYYEDVYNRMLERVDARAAEVRSGEYAEVDNPEDMSAAAAVVERHSGLWTPQQQTERA